MKAKRRRTVEAYLEQGGACYWCFRPMDPTMRMPDDTPDNSATADHLNPAIGGKRFHLYIDHNINHVVAACRRCNSMRGAVWGDLLNHIKRNKLVPLEPGYE